MSTAAQVYVMLDILRERNRQEQLFKEGKVTVKVEDPTAPIEHKLAVLGEEFGEVCHEINEMTNGNVFKDQAFRDRLQAELTQVAACAMAWCEGLELEAVR